MFGPARRLVSKKQASGKEKIQKLPCEQILQAFGFFRAFIQPVFHGEQRGKF